MADLSKIKLNSTVYHLKDKESREITDLIKTYGAIRFIETNDIELPAKILSYTKTVNNCNSLITVNIYDNGILTQTQSMSVDPGSWEDYNNHSDQPNPNIYHGSLSLEGYSSSVNFELHYNTISQEFELYRLSNYPNGFYSGKIEFYVFAPIIDVANVGDQYQNSINCTLYTNQTISDDYSNQLKISDKVIHHDDVSSIRIFQYPISGQRINNASFFGYTEINSVNSFTVFDDYDYESEGVYNSDPYYWSYGSNINQHDDASMLAIQCRDDGIYLGSQFADFVRQEGSEEEIPILFIISWINSNSRIRRVEQFIEDLNYRMNENRGPYKYNLTKATINHGNYTEPIVIDTGASVLAFPLDLSIQHIDQHYNMGIVVKDSITHEIIALASDHLANWRYIDDHGDGQFTFTIDDVEYFLEILFIKKYEKHLQGLSLEFSSFLLRDQNYEPINNIPFDIDIYVIYPELLATKNISKQNSIFCDFMSLSNLLSGYSVDITNSFKLGDSYGWFKLSDKPLLYKDRNTFMVLTRTGDMIENPSNIGIEWNNEEDIMHMMNSGIEHNDSNGFDVINIMIDGEYYVSLFLSAVDGFYIYLPTLMDYGDVLNTFLNPYSILTYQTEWPDDAIVYYTNDNINISCNYTYQQILKSHLPVYIISPDETISAQFEINDSELTISHIGADTDGDIQGIYFYHDVDNIISNIDSISISAGTGTKVEVVRLI